MSQNPLTEMLRPHVAELKRQSDAGDESARQVITLYQMYVRCPGDPGAPALCEEAFNAWRAREASR
jgi:hypothetical protein